MSSSNGRGEGVREETPLAQAEVTKDHAGRGEGVNSILVIQTDTREAIHLGDDD